MKLQKFIITIFLVLMLCFILWGWLFGFSYEKNILITAVREYVETKYRLTPTNIQITFSIDGMDSAVVSVEEYPFKFQVYVSRENKNVLGDLYLEELTEYHLKKLIGKKLNSFADVNNIRVVLESRFSKSNPEITMEKINANPNMLLNIPDIMYFCSIDVEEIDSQKSFLIFSKLTRSFNPTCIYFHYEDIDGKKKSVCIKKDDFNKVQKKEDIVNFIK